MKQINETDLESMLEGQIPEAVSALPERVAEPEPVGQVESAPIEPAEVAQPAKPAGYQVGDTLKRWTAAQHGESDEEYEERAARQGFTKVGGNIYQNAEVREGWVPVDKRYLGDRALFYPADWQFKIRPATVEAIRNWSTIDEENFNSVDDVFNEILKSCLSISSNQGPLPWGNIRSWDRFFFVLLIREFSMKNGDVKIEFTEDCPNCENPVPFILGSQSLLYTLPDEDIINYFDQASQTWVIDPTEYDIEAEPITLYLPTLDKDASIKAWMIQRAQDNKKIDPVFVKFLPWMAPRISKDATMAARQIKEYEAKFKSWDIDMFSFMDDVIKNITVTPETKLVTTCPVCGEEMSAPIRFPNGIGALFSMARGHRKFGKK